MRIPVPGLLVHGLALGWTSTWTVVRLHERRWLDAIAGGRGVVGVMWHQSLLMAAASHHHRKVAAMASRNLDGGLIAAHLSRIGVRTVRGSSRRGGADGARELMRALAEGWTVTTPVDGPTGPAFAVKPGLIEIARRCRAPLMPTGFAAGRCWEIPRAWDRFRLPWPGTRIAVCYGEPFEFPHDEPDEAELARRCALVAGRINALQAEAQRAVGG